MAERQHPRGGRKTILLTGGSGVLGQALLGELTGATLIALGHRAPVGGHGGRLEVVAGDITSPRLGLSPGDYETLARRVNWIIHAAASTNFRLDEESVFRTNVRGTLRVLELAARSGAPLCHVSSAFAHAGRYTRSTVAATNYERSKAESERVVRSSGLPHMIVRPSVIIGDSRTGALKTFQGLYQVVGLVLKGHVPVLPVGQETRFDFLPQDCVAEAIAALVDRGRAGGEFWLTAGDSAPRVDEVFGWITAFGRARLGIDIRPPKLVGCEVYERLIAPVFLRALPGRVQSSVQRLMPLTRYFDIDQPLPSSLPELRLGLGLGPLPDLRDSFERSLAYWAAANAPDGVSQRRRPRGQRPRVHS